jgi:hypothetical protein
MENFKSPTCVSVRKAALSPWGMKSFREWNSQPNHLYIGMDMTHYIQGAVGSKWQNTFTNIKSLRKSLELYEERVRNTPELIEAIGELEGMELGVLWKSTPCHGDVLIKIFNDTFITN